MCSVHTKTYQIPQIPCSAKTIKMSGADLLVSSWCENVKTVPANYILPPERRPQVFSICKDIPVIDLGQAEAGEDRADLLDQMIKASHEFGVFQVINHGISEEMQEARSLNLDFFKKTRDEKQRLYSEDKTKSVRLHTSGYNYSSEEIHYWKDTLNLPCYPLERHIQYWPKNPPGFREVMGTYSGEVRKLALRIVDLIGEGLGLEQGYFAAEYSTEHGILISHYPPCPDPSLALGIGPHCDPYLITLIQQDAYGLQVTNEDGQWVGVEAIPNAMVVVIANQLEIISNGKLRSCVHRVVTNSDVDRISIISFLYPDHECVVGPAKELVNASNPPLYKSYKYIEFLERYFGCLPKRDLSVKSTVGPFQLQS